jgi:ABC-type transporter Mla maintaining outer membrane lipid asymmetry ATPase subunit MlaF
MNENPPQPVIEMLNITVSAMRDLKEIVVEGVNWSVAAGDFWVVAGTPYSGKSNFLMTTAGLTSPLAGAYRFLGHELRAAEAWRLGPQRRPGFVFEGGRLFNHLTIAENVALPQQYHSTLTDGEVNSSVENLLELMGMSWFAHSLPPNVSSNWIKRAGLARTLTLQPQVLLLDNPLRGLDAHHTKWWLEFLDKLSRGQTPLGSAKMTIIVTTDDLRPWQDDRRKFALLNERKFIPLGNWGGVVASNHAAVKTLRAISLAAIIGETEA